MWPDWMMGRHLSPLNTCCATHPITPTRPPTPPPHTDRPFWNSYPAINRSQKKRQVTDISRSKVVIVEQTLHNLIALVIGAFPQSGTSLFPQDSSETKFDFLLFWRLIQYFILNSCFLQLYVLLSESVSLLSN